MKDRLTQIGETAREEIAAATSEQALAQVRIKYLGKKGLVTPLLRSIASLPEEGRPQAGQSLNELRAQIERGIHNRLTELQAAARAGMSRAVDLTLPGRRPLRGSQHPLTQVMEEVIDLFAEFGFHVAQGPEIESDYYNFEALNMPRDHPARDMQDTFYISEEIVLRTHTSPVQIRVMESQQPPIRVIAPGKVYRCDADISHTPMFHQVEGLMVDRGVAFSDLKGILQLFTQRFFGRSTPLRFRPSFFPFTEPSAEVDVRCVMCNGDGCRVCGHCGWLEILGAGMVDPAVFTHVDYDPERYSGFAFGMGIERLTMLKFGIDDIRLFFENDLHFLRQF